MVELTWRGDMLGWIGPGHRPTATAPDPDGEDGLGLLRSFTGFLVTCGYDFFGPPRSGPADHFAYPLRQRLHYPVHGRASFLPATVEGRRIEEDRITIDLRLSQASLFGTVFDIRRQWQIGIDRPTLRLTDRIENVGLTRSPFMVLYHINLGHPLIDTGTEIDGLPPHPDMPSPLPPLLVGLTEKGRFLPRSDVADWVTIRTQDGLRLAVGLGHPGLTHVGQWWNRFSGMNCVSVEPATANMPALADAPWEPPDWLEVGESRSLALDFEVGGPPR
jgi:hypothetical protein